MKNPEESENQSAFSASGEGFCPSRSEFARTGAQRSRYL
jgi:hypothetical protein